MTREPRLVLASLSGEADARWAHEGSLWADLAMLGGVALDRDSREAARALVALALIALVFVGPQTPWGWVGLVPLVTGLVGTCPAYRLLGIRTCRVSPRGA